MRDVVSLLTLISVLSTGCLKSSAPSIDVNPPKPTRQETIANGRIILKLETPEQVAQGITTITCIVTNASHDSIYLPLWVEHDKEPNFFVWLKRPTDGQLFACSKQYTRNVLAVDGTTITPGETRLLRGEFVVSAPPGRYFLICKLAPCKDVYSDEVAIDVIAGSDIRKPSKSF